MSSHVSLSPSSLLGSSFSLTPPPIAASSSSTAQLIAPKPYDEVARGILKSLKSVLPSFPKIKLDTPTVTPFIKSLEMI
jgi:hypothetical protein